MNKGVPHLIRRLVLPQLLQCTHDIYIFVSVDTLKLLYATHTSIHEFNKLDGIYYLVCSQDLDVLYRINDFPILVCNSLSVSG